MDYSRRSADRGRAMDLGDPRTPMAWQHRDHVSNTDYDSSYRSNRASASPNSNGTRRNTQLNGVTRYGAPPTPGSAHSRGGVSARATPDHRRRDARGSSSERYVIRNG